MGRFEGVPGELRGVFFKGVVGSMLGGDMLFPEIAATVAAMDDDRWYPWSEYLEVLDTIAGSLNATVLKVAGEKVVLASKDLFIAQGFDTLEKLLRAYPEMFDMNVRGVAASERVELVEYTPGHAVFHYGATQPPAMIEGYFRGFFEIYDALVDDITIRPTDDARLRVEVRWSPE